MNDETKDGAVEGYVVTAPELERAVGQAVQRFTPDREQLNKRMVQEAIRAENRLTGETLLKVAVEGLVLGGAVYAGASFIRWWLEPVFGE